MLGQKFYLLCFKGKFQKYHFNAFTQLNTTYPANSVILWKNSPLPKWLFIHIVYLCVIFSFHADQNEFKHEFFNTVCILVFHSRDTDLKISLYLYLEVQY